MAEPLALPLPESADAGAVALVLRQAATGWPLARSVDSGEFYERFRAVAVIASRNDHEERSMTLGESIELNTGSCHPWYVHWNVHEHRGDLTGELPRQFESWYDWLPVAVRPSWTWIFVGPSGTGTSLHVDTMGSSAWNALMSGVKQWRVLSPQRSVRAGLVSDVVAATLTDVGDVEYRCTQHPGDLLVVPGGWAHEVVNVGDTVSITGNYVNASNIDTVEATLASGNNDAWGEITRRVRAAAEARTVLGQG